MTLLIEATSQSSTVKNTGPSTKQEKCPRCVKFHLGGPNACRSRSMICRICGKMGHIADVHDVECLVLRNRIIDTLGDDIYFPLLVSESKDKAPTASNGGDGTPFDGFSNTTMAGTNTVRSKQQKGIAEQSVQEPLIEKELLEQNSRQAMLPSDSASKLDEGSQTNAINVPSEKEDISEHMLYNEWRLWFLKNNHCDNWETNQKVVASISSVETFWALFDHIKRPSKLESGCDYSLFKSGIKPLWEDVNNCDGGRWLITLEKADTELLDKLWLNVSMLLIGEAFLCDGKYVNGAVVSVRRNMNKIGIWLSNSNKKVVSNIGEKLFYQLEFDKPIKVCFEAHKENMLADSPPKIVSA